MGEVLREGRAGPGQTTKDPRPGQGLTGEELSLEPGLTRTPEEDLGMTREIAQ